MFWKAKKPQGLAIARLEGRNRGPMISIPHFLLVIGFMAMFIVFFTEHSAIQLAAYGAIWTGWNVMCGIGVLTSYRVDYVVYREAIELPVDDWGGHT